MILPAAQTSKIAKALSSAFSKMAFSFSAPLSILQDFDALQTELPQVPWRALPPAKEKAKAALCKLSEPSPYNRKTPFVLVDIGGNKPTRGDTHGFVGIATRLAQKIGAKLCIIDDEDLLDRYPYIKELSAAGETSLQLRRKAYFREEGYPDFYFAHAPGTVSDFLNKQSSGLMITAYNENITDALIPSYSSRVYASVVVPHHLTPETLAFEGEKFANEYADLPRPFIAINFISNITRDPYVLPERLTEIVKAYPEATFFVCSCHRTDYRTHSEFLDILRAQISDHGDRFHVVDFDFNENNRAYGKDGFWNPYKGMIHQADHIVQVGYSISMVSEALATGKAPYVTPHISFNDAVEYGYIKNIFAHKAGKPLPSEHIAPIDLTGECADILLQKFIEHKKIRNGAKRKKIFNATHQNPYLHIS